MAGWKEFGDQLATSITADQARVVGELRVDRDLTWRAVAEHFYDRFPDVLYGQELRGNEGAGMFLCEAAACRLGEDPNDDPWN